MVLRAGQGAGLEARECSRVHNEFGVAGWLGCLRHVNSAILAVPKSLHMGVPQALGGVRVGLALCSLYVKGRWGLFYGTPKFDLWVTGRVRPACKGCVKSMSAIRLLVHYGNNLPWLVIITSLHETQQSYVP